MDRPSSIRFEIELGERIGGGGFGDVFRASLAGVKGVEFAVKMLHRSINQKPAFTRRFLREAEIMFRLRHPYIITCHGVGTYEERPYILMELFDGTSLQEYVAGPQFTTGTETANRSIPLIRRVTEALDYAHGVGVVHRDLNPGNILGNRDRADTRLLDFGLSRLQDPKLSGLTPRHGLPVGHYAAPELEEDRACSDPRCDIYSLGAVWFHLLTGKSHKSSNKRSLMEEAGVPAQIAELIERCTGALEQRPDASSLLDDLRALEQQEVPRSLRSRSEIELAILAALGEDDHRREPDEGFQVASIIDGVSLIEPSGYRRNGALRRLVSEGLVTESVEAGWNHDSYRVVTLSDQGWAWLDENDELVAPVAARLRDAAASVPVAADSGGGYGSSDDDIPF